MMNHMPDGLLAVAVAFLLQLPFYEYLADELGKGIEVNPFVHAEGFERDSLAFKEPLPEAVWRTSGVDFIGR